MATAALAARRPLRDGAAKALPSFLDRLALGVAHRLEDAPGIDDAVRIEAGALGVAHCELIGLALLWSGFTEREDR